jgi:hypothetical protein
MIAETLFRRVQNYNYFIASEMKSEMVWFRVVDEISCCKHEVKNTNRYTQYAVVNQVVNGLTN